MGNEINLPRPPSLFTLKEISINNVTPFLNNFILIDSVNSFSSSLIFLIVFFKLSKFSCLVFLAL